jgi:Xaa-Pro aminopeptidase
MKQNFFQSNQRRLFQVLGSGVCVVSAHVALQRTNDTSFIFEQEANFWYLTGIEVPNWWVIIDGKKNKSWLVAPDVDKMHQVFDGSLSWDEAKRISGVDEVLSRADADDLLRTLTKKNDVVYTLGTDSHAKHYDFFLNPAQRQMQTRLSKIFSDVHDCRLELAQLRATKQPHEIAAMKKAITLTVDTFVDVKRKLPSLLTEYEVEAEFSYNFGKNGGIDHAYDPIIASGKNACTLHYNSNKDRLEEGALLLIDIGARVDGYAADITRTYAFGTPTQRQRDVHAAVEQAHHDIIALLNPGLDVRMYHQSVDTIMKRELIGLGLMKSPSDETAYRKYFPHAISHGLGIDVHDSLGGPDVFLPGMVLTVEPGIYIPEEAIGVRIEDDILITETGHENLSGHLSTSL